MTSWLKLFLMVWLLLATVFVTLIVSLQSHICILETTPENWAALLMGLQYLINISYVDDIEFFKVGFWCELVFSSSILHGNKHGFLLIILVLLQVCLDDWNDLVSEIFEAHHSSYNPTAAANVMGLQVKHIWYLSLSCFNPCPLFFFISRKFWFAKNIKVCMVLFSSIVNFLCSMLSSIRRNI